MIKGELKIMNLDEFTTAHEVSWIVAQEENCRPEDVKVSNIKIMRSGLGIAWIKFHTVGG